MNRAKVMQLLGTTASDSSSMTVVASQSNKYLIASGNFSLCLLIAFVALCYRIFSEEI